ncbi:MAG TPA: DnaJ domain-containing protein [Rectinemataceae bacterium]|nr:DnaJ domain-containing protein [Rectinemataceae bacterium]
MSVEPWVDPRTVLGLGPGADAEDVRLAYRRLARRYHPDVSGDPATAASFGRVTKAYKLLTALPPSALPQAGLPGRYRRVIDAGDDLFALGQILVSDPDAGARAEAAKRLGLSGRVAAWVFLRRALYDEDEAVAGQAVRSVALLGAMQAEGEVASLYVRSGGGLRRLVLEVAEATLEPVFAGALDAAKNDGDPVLRARARRIGLLGPA